MPQPTIFASRLVAATIQEWLLFQGGIYFIGKAADISDSWIRYVRAMQWWLLHAVSSKCSLSVLLSAMEMIRAAQTALALAQWPLSGIVHIHVCVLHIVAGATYLRVAFISLIVRLLSCGQQLFKGGIYSIKYGKTTPTLTILKSVTHWGEPERAPH